MPFSTGQPQWLPGRVNHDFHSSFDSCLLEPALFQLSSGCELRIIGYKLQELHLATEWE